MSVPMCTTVVHNTHNCRAQHSKYSLITFSLIIQTIIIAQMMSIVYWRGGNPAGQLVKINRAGLYTLDNIPVRGTTVGGKDTVVDIDNSSSDTDH